MRSTATTAVLGAAVWGQLTYGKTCIPRASPFDVVDPQNWVNPDDMIWDDWKKPPGTTWNDPSKKGSERNFNIALIVFDFEDLPFVVSQAPNSTIFGNPQPEAANVPRDDVPTFYRDLLNKPGDLNRGHTLHEYWMEDSGGRFGVDLTSFGPYRMSALSYQYGVDNSFNPGACPEGRRCSLNIRTESQNIWRAAVGNDTVESFESVFILLAGQDESATWQEFGEMKFASREDVPDSFGPPPGVNGNQTLSNWAATRYVPWTSWASASTFWPNAGGGISVQCESSGSSTFAHELSHLLNIADNYNNPYGVPLRRAFTGPWSMLSRGTFNGPGGPHTRWQIPSLKGSSMGSLHTMRDKAQLGLLGEDQSITISSTEMVEAGLVVAQLTARAVDSGLMGIRIDMEADLTPACNINTDVFCDGGGYDAYNVEVVDRMGSDSFQPDAGVLISKIKNLDRAPFQWVIDANPQDIELLDFIRPNGTKAMITLGDYRQLADALFHAGTRSGSEYEHLDEPNGLHFYILNIHRDDVGVLSYSVGVRSLNATATAQHGVELADGSPVGGRRLTPTGEGVWCSFELRNNGTYEASSTIGERVAALTGSDIYRLEAQVEGSGWRVEVPNALVAAKFGETVSANVAVGASLDAADEGIVTLTVKSESDESVTATAECRVAKA
ncbi:putative secreted metallopeptidase [Paramyrothecium foliicola]|nr:putative secreted metallopeptidase [Paramyrothecium foliicola]